LFALGVVLHEMLSNVHPFDADNEHALLSNIQHGTRPELASLVPDLPEDVARLLDRLLEVDLLARAQSAREALDMLPLFGSQFSVQRSLAELVELHASARAEDASEAQPSPAPTTEPLGSHAERTVDVAAIASDRTLGAHARVSGAAARVSRGAKWALVSALMATLAYALWLGGSRAPRLVRAPTSSTAVRDAGPSRGERAVALPGALSPALEPATPASPALHQASPAQPPAAALELPVRPAAAAEARGSAHEQNGEAPPPAAAQVKGRSGVALRADEF
jgi:serine/threonine-protein kinase